jgi:hypothetical protein
VKSILSALFVIITLATNAQERRTTIEQFDFSGVDPAKVDLNKLRQYRDSLYIVHKIDSLHVLAQYVNRELSRKKFSYTSVNFGFEFAKMSIGKLNKELVQNGFEELSETFSAVNFGYDIVEDRWLVSTMFNIGISEKLRNDEVKLSFASSGQVSMSVGYDLLNWKRIHFYPFLGASYQKFSMDVKRRGIEPDQDLQYYFDNVYRSTFKRRTLEGLAGAQLDVQLTKPKYESVQVILAIRGGVQTTLIDGDLRMSDGGYVVNVGDVGRESFLSVGFKLFVR